MHDKNEMHARYTFVCFQGRIHVPVELNTGRPCLVAPLVAVAVDCAPNTGHDGTSGNKRLQTAAIRYILARGSTLSETEAF